MISIFRSVDHSAQMARSSHRALNRCTLVQSVAIVRYSAT